MDEMPRDGGVFADETDDVDRRALRGVLHLRLEGDDRQAEIQVTDTGPGFDPRDIPYLFDPLFSTKVNAVGMNLAITKRIVSDHLGEITARNEPGLGARLTITLPLKPPLVQTPPDGSEGDPGQHYSI